MNDELCEHLSRTARTQLISILLEKFDSTMELASEIGVTEKAVRKWVSRATHPSNVHLRRILELAIALDKERAEGILKYDLMRFLDAIGSCS